MLCAAEYSTQCVFALSLLFTFMRCRKCKSAPSAFDIFMFFLACFVCFDLSPIFCLIYCHWHWQHDEVLFEPRSTFVSVLLPRAPKWPTRSPFLLGGPELTESPRRDHFDIAALFFVSPHATTWCAAERSPKCIKTCAEVDQDSNLQLGLHTPCAGRST